MRIALIVAMAENRVIGHNNQLPWHIRADLQHFRQLTMGNPIIMGRRTHESIGRPLPGRDNIVITADRQYQADGCQVVHSIDQALEAGDQNPDVRVSIIRGAGPCFSAGYDLQSDVSKDQPFYTAGGLANWPRHVVEALRLDAETLK